MVGYYENKIHNIGAFKMNTNNNIISDYYSDVMKIIIKDESERYSDGKSFNIFKLLNLESEELKHSRLIAELVNSKATHKMGAQYLQLFIEEMITKGGKIFEGINNDLSKAIIYREKDNIDILILLPSGYTIIIENKINAYDQPQQLYRYYNIVKNNHKRNKDKIIVLYLTLDEHEPSEHSIKNIKDKVICVSYAVDIINWLEKCISITTSANIRIILEQYKATVFYLVGNDESEELMKNLSEYILLNKQNFIVATETAKAINYAKTDIMLKLFNFYKSELLSAGYSESYIYFPVEEIKSYYFEKGKKIPHIGVKISKVNTNLYLYFGIELDWNLYYYFAFANEDFEFIDRTTVRSKHKETYDCIEKAIWEDNIITSKQTDVSVLWEYIYDIDGEKYNFKQCTANIAELVDNCGDEAKRIFAELFILINKVIKNLSKESFHERNK